MNIGCLFGTFDPPHYAHVAIAEHMLKARRLDQVWLVVTPANPLKTGRPASPENHRLAMVRLALMKHEGLQASGVELDQPRPNYTAHSLKFMRQRWPHDHFDLIIGSDNLALFHQWKDPEEILEHHDLLVYPRPVLEDHLRESRYSDHPKVHLIEDAPMMDISSTAIRQAISEWRPVQDLIDPAVLSYIRQHQLYKP